MIPHLRSRTSPPRRYRLNNNLSNRHVGHRSHRRQLLLQQRRPQPHRPWQLHLSRGRPKMIPLPQPRIMHHHQNGRVVVSGERVVDNSWLINFFPPFFSPCFSVIPTCTRYVCGSHSTHLTSEISLFSCCRSRKSMPLEFSLFLPPPFIVDCTLVTAPFPRFCPQLPPSFLRVDIAYSPLSRVGHLRVTSALLFFFLFIPFVLYNHRITSGHIHLTNFLQFLLFFPFILKKIIAIGVL